MSAQHMILRVQRALAPDPRHLVVSLALRPRSVTVVSVAVAPGRPPQLLWAGHSWLTAVTRGEEVVHLSRVPDPFAQRGIGVDRRGPNPLGPNDEGRAVVAVPFGAVKDLTRSLVHVLDLGPHRGLSDWPSLGGELGRRLAAASDVRTVDFEAITASPQWAAAGELLGLSVRPGR